MARRLGVDPRRVRQRIHARSLYAFKQGGAWLVPPFQLDGHKLVPGLDAVVSRLSPMLHPVAVSRWFQTPNPELLSSDRAVSPVEWLSSDGPPEAVASQAAALDQL